MLSKDKHSSLFVRRTFSDEEEKVFTAFDIWQLSSEKGEKREKEFFF